MPVQPTSAAIIIGMGKRVAEFAALEGLTQKELASRLGISQGFLSSVINGLKIPGCEFLYTLKKEFGVSTDWVLTGEGNLYGESKINIQLQKEIRLYIAIARAAVVDKNPTAKALILLLQEGRSQEAAQDKTLQAFLDGLVYRESDVDLSTALYNSHLWVNNRDTQRRNVIADAVEHFELGQPASVFGTDTRAKGGGGLQINIGRSQVISPGDVKER